MQQRRYKEGENGCPGTHVTSPAGGSSKADGCRRMGALRRYANNKNSTTEVKILASGPYSPPLQILPADHSMLNPVNLIVSPLTLAPKRGSVKFQPKCSPMGSQISWLRRNAYPNRMPNPAVLANPSQLAFGFPACSTAKITPTGTTVVQSPNPRSRTWN